MCARLPLVDAALPVDRAGRGPIPCEGEPAKTRQAPRDTQEIGRRQGSRVLVGVVRRWGAHGFGVVKGALPR